MADSPHLSGEFLVAEDDNYNDFDSAYGSQGAASSMISINESILRFRQENGRSYHKYKDGKYMVPNDEGENERLDLQHHLCLLTLCGKLFLSPAGKANSLHRVLDVGTGTGIWAIDFADEHPESEVLGIDLSPIQPSFVPPNLRFQIDDLEEPWSFTNKFDFIYSRMMTGSFSDWSLVLDQAYQNLNPGGFIEVMDCIYPIKTDDDTFPKDSTLKKWGELMVEGFALIGRPLDSALHSKELFEAAGFINVVEVDFKWPINQWPKNARSKELGLWAFENLYWGIEGLSLAVFTRMLRWTKDETLAFLAEVKKEIRDTKIHSYMPVRIIYGQKPPESSLT